jgi:Mlc titration factor MtfA (ptsG expression regulator)
MYRSNTGGKKDYLVLYDKGMYSGPGELDFGLMSKAVIHELSHSLDDELPGVFSKWLQATGWFKENGQWLSKSHEFVNEYAASHPKEDFAESFSSYVLEPERLMKASPARYEFMDELFNTNGAA